MKKKKTAKWGRSIYLGILVSTCILLLIFGMTFVQYYSENALSGSANLGFDFYYSENTLHTNIFGKTKEFQLNSNARHAVSSAKEFVPAYLQVFMQIFELPNYLLTLIN